MNVVDRIARTVAGSLEGNSPTSRRNLLRAFATGGAALAGVIGYSKPVEAANWYRVIATARCRLGPGQQNAIIGTFYCGNRILGSILTGGTPTSYCQYYGADWVQTSWWNQSGGFSQTCYVYRGQVINDTTSYSCLCA